MDEHSLECLGVVNLVELEEECEKLLSDPGLDRLAHPLGNLWQSITFRLGLKIVDIVRIEGSYQDDVWSQIRNALVEWREQNKYTPMKKVKELLEVLCEPDIKQDALADVLKQEYKLHGIDMLVKPYAARDDIMAQRCEKLMSLSGLDGLADQLGSSWKSITIRLGLKIVDISRIVGSYQHNVWFQIRKALVEWREQNNDKNPVENVKKLLAVLCEPDIKQDALANDLKQKYKLDGIDM